MMMTHRVPIPGPLNLSLTVSSVTALSSRCYCPPGCSCPREVHEAAFPTPGVPCGRPRSSHRARSLCQTHPLRYRLIKDPEARLSFCIWKSRTRALWGSKNTSGMESLATQMGQIRGNKILSCVPQRRTGNPSDAYLAKAPERGSDSLSIPC